LAAFHFARIPQARGCSCGRKDRSGSPVRCGRSIGPLRRSCFKPELPWQRRWPSRPLHPPFYDPLQSRPDIPPTFSKETERMGVLIDAGAVCQAIFGGDAGPVVRFADLSSKWNKVEVAGVLFPRLGRKMRL
jgi:hypothetical protein